MDELEASIITKTGPGFEVADIFGDILGSFTDWGQVANMYRRQGFSKEYIARRKAAVEFDAGTAIGERKY